MEDRASVAGTVVDENGSPVSGAEVELVEIPDSPRTCWDEEASANYHATRTGLTGHFEVDGLPATLIDLRIDYPGFAPLIRKGIVVPDPVGGVNVGRLTLDAGRKVDGIVVDGKGRPLAGTAIWVRSMEPGPEGYPFLRRGPRQVTGADGRFSIHVEPKGPFELYACRRDRSRLTETLDGPSRPLRIVMPASGRLPGRVVDPEGRPVAGARVLVAMAAEGSPGDLIDLYDPCPQTDSSVSAVTDAEGRFVLEPVVQGVFGVMVLADDFAPYAQQEARLGGAGGLRSLDVVLRGGASITGQVRSMTGAPVPGVSIDVVCPDGGSNALTGPDGQYRLSGLSSGGTCRLSASKYRFNEARETVEIKATVNHLDLRLVPVETVEIHGRVIGPAGEPVAGAKVESRGAFEAREILTGLDGSFTVETYTGSGDCAFSVGKEGYAPYRPPSVPCDEAAAKEAVIRLERALTLTGRLLNLDPEQLWTAHVYAENDLFLPPSISVSPDGTYRIEDLGPGEWKVSAIAGRRSVEAQVTLRPGQEDATLDLSFGSQFPVRGRVFGPEDEGIAGASVDFLGANYFSDQVSTQADGSFEILLENGSYEVLANAPSGPHAPTGDRWSLGLLSITVADAPVEGIDFHLKKGVALHGCIPGLLPDERPIIYASHEDTSWSSEIEADGCYRFTSLEPGDWSITARLDTTSCRGCLQSWGEGNDRRIQSHVTVAPGASETVLDLDLALGDRTLTVCPAGADKHGELCLRLLFPDGRALVDHACQGINGAIRIPRLRTGDYQIQIMDRKGQVLLKRSVELTSDQEMVVEVP